MENKKTHTKKFIQKWTLHLLIALKVLKQKVKENKQTLKKRKKEKKCAGDGGSSS